MNHECARVSSNKNAILNKNKKLNTTDTDSCSMKKVIGDSRCLNPSSKAVGKHRMKHLKSRRERGKGASQYKSHHHRCSQQTRKAPSHNCCRGSCHCPSSRDALFPNVVPAAQEPSIITDSRLTGHQGLFNHEVKSIHIERLISQQSKLEKSGQEAPERSNAISHPPLTSHRHSPSFSPNFLLGADSEVLIAPASKARDEFQETDKKFSQGSDLTPGQRPQQQPGPSSLDKEVDNSWETSRVLSENSDSQQTPTVDREDVTTLNQNVKGLLVSSLEDTPKKQTPAHGVRPLQHSSSYVADRRDADGVSKSVSAVAASLCDSLQFPRLKRRNLLEESREVLLKALRKTHGGQLQENLFKLQRCLSLGADPTKEVPQQETTVRDKDELLPTEAFGTARKHRFGTKETTSSKITRSRHFNWKSSPLLHHNLPQSAEWLASPMETSASFLDDALTSSRSPQFPMDFELFRVTARDHLFAPSPASRWGENASAPQNWEDNFNGPKNKEAVMFGSFEDGIENPTRANSSGPQYDDGNVKPFFPYQAPDRQSTGPAHYPQHHDPFQTSRHSFVPSSYTQSQHPQQHNPFLGQFSHHSVCPPLADMTQYPPSHMLERDPAPPLPSFPSPEHWSFPPMRLY